MRAWQNRDVAAQALGAVNWPLVCLSVHVDGCVVYRTCANNRQTSFGFAIPLRQLIAPFYRLAPILGQLFLGNEGKPTALFR